MIRASSRTTYAIIESSVSHLPQKKEIDSASRFLVTNASFSPSTTNHDYHVNPDETGQNTLPPIECADEKTRAYILQNTVVAQLCINAAHRLSDIFEHSVRFLITFREEEEELFFYVLTTFPVKEALSRLNQFEEEWWLDLPWEKRKLIVFSLKFVR